MIKTITAIKTINIIVVKFIGFFLFSSSFTPDALFVLT